MSNIFQRYFDSGYKDYVCAQGPRKKQPSYLAHFSEVNPTTRSEYIERTEWRDASWNDKPQKFDPQQYSDLGAGTCLLMRPQYCPGPFLFGIDFDISDPNLAKKAAATAIQSIGEGMVRLRNGVPRMIVYRTTEFLPHFRSVYFQRHYRDNLVIEETKEQIDFRENGHVVMEGLHESGSMQEVANFMEFNDLPNIKMNQIASLWDELLLLKPQSWEVEEHRGDGKIYKLSDAEQRENKGKPAVYELPVHHAIRVTGTRKNPIDVEVMVGDMLQDPSYFIGMTCFDPFYWNDSRYSIQPRICNILPNTAKNSYFSPLVISSWRRQALYFIEMPVSLKSKKII